MESGVDPSNNLRSADEISRIHHSDFRRHCFFLWVLAWVGCVGENQASAFLTAIGVRQTEGKKSVKGF